MDLCTKKGEDHIQVGQYMLVSTGATETDIKQLFDQMRDRYSEKYLNMTDDELMEHCRNYYKNAPIIFRPYVHGVFR